MNNPTGDFPAMMKFSMNTFLKLCLLDTGEKISELQKRLNGPGGYDFYKPLQRAVRLHSAGEHKKALEVLEAPVNLTERKHNQDAFEKFRTRFGTVRTLSPVDEKGSLKFTSDGIEILPDPLFEITKGGIRQVYCLWPTQSPELTQRYGAVACYIMRSAFKHKPIANAGFYLADLVSGRIYSEKQITNNTSLILSSDVASIGSIIKQI